MTAILGISAYYHDSAAALIVDGRVVAAAQEERFSRRKHDASFPSRAIDYCLSHAGLTRAQLDAVGFYEKPLLKFDRLLETYLSFAPAGFQSFRKAMPEWTGTKLHLRRMIRCGLRNEFRGRICFCEHHESHAASAFFPSPFEQAAILTMDGVGEWATTSLGRGSGNRIDITHQISFPHSLGLLYSAVTSYAGFQVNSDEYKLMGLAPYGQPIYVDRIMEKLITLYEDGSYRLNLDYFNYCQGLTMTSRSFHRLFGRPPRKPGESIQQLDMDLAASIQAVTEEAVLRMAHHLHQLTKLDACCLAGGVALNCVANGRLQREGPFKQLWIQPAAGDAGGALGVAWLIWHQLMNQPRTVTRPDAQSGSLLGPEPQDDDMAGELRNLGAVYQKFADNEAITNQVVDDLVDGKLVGISRGRMEFGPRALGNRSILADARRAETQRELNLKTKFRESFRPFAPIVLAEHASEIFDWKPDDESPYMLLVSHVTESLRVRQEITGERGLERVHEDRSSLPAITHVDYSARLQTVDKSRNKELRGLLEVFMARTGCPVLVNTSFNVRDEPIVCNWVDALACFMSTKLDTLVLDDLLLRKSDQTVLNMERLLELRRQLSMNETEQNAKQREASWFAGSLVTSLAIVACLLQLKFAAATGAITILIIALLLAVVAIAVPSSRLTIQHCVQMLTFPLRAALTLALLGVIYYGMVTPIGLMRRMSGHSIRHSAVGQSTSWISRHPRDLESYFRTY